MNQLARHAFIPPQGFKSHYVVMRVIVKFLEDENAATATEYGLIASGIAVAIIGVTQGLGTKLKTTFSAVSTALK